MSRYLRRTEPNELPWPEDARLDWPEIASLTGGHLRVFQAATVWLVQHRILEYRASDRVLVVLLPLPEAATDAARDVFEFVALAGGEESIDRAREWTCRREGTSRLEPFRYSSSRRVELVSFAICQFPASVVPGAAPFLVAFHFVESDRVIGPLLILISFLAYGAVLAFSFVMMCVLSARKHTALGERVLARELELIWPDRPFFFLFHPPPPHSKDNLALVVAAFGESTLRKSDLAGLLPGLTDPNAGGE